MNQRIAGIDFGMARIGVAISDVNKIIATSLSTIKAEKNAEETAKKVLAELLKHAELNKYELEKIIVGMPLLLSGKKGLLADEASHFINLLKTISPCPVEPWDERLTTAQAERSLKESSLTRKRRSQVVDAVAAVIILQNYLDSLSFQSK